MRLAVQKDITLVFPYGSAALTLYRLPKYLEIPQLLAFLASIPPPLTNGPPPVCKLAKKFQVVKESIV
jgi:hypothetical protein